MVVENDQDDVLLADLRRAMHAGGTPNAGSDRSPEASVHAFDLHPGSQLDGYEIVDLIGHGGISMVYRARQCESGAVVAMKVVPRPGGALLTSQFRREMEAAARLKHPHILPIIATGHTSGCLYIVMPLCHPLPSIEPSAPAPPGETSVPPSDLSVYSVVAAQFADIADALAYAHERGIIHRDVKPPNILVGSGGRWQLGDFGLARVQDAASRTTTLGAMGTPSYASPEQLTGSGSDLTGLTDVYSLGATIYEVLTGCPPFSAPTLDRLVHKIRCAEPRRPRALDARIPTQLETICLRALRKDPRQRYDSMRALGDDLNLFAQARPIVGRRVSRMEKLSGHLRYRRGFFLFGAGTCALGVLLLLVLLRNAGIRQDQADQTVALAFDRLTYNDYQRPDAIKADLEGALPYASGGPLPSLAQALVCLGESRGDAVFAHLDAALREAPDDPTALYMGAWAQWRHRDRPGFDDAWRRAESSPRERSDAAWFYRGLAIHRSDPNEAILSYRQANELRTAQHEFFPQALLHLARARNQLLYRYRSMEAFEESKTSLEQLIDNGHYGSYPYYLLSIAYRLGAEASVETEAVAAADRRRDMLEQAVHWAREGQRLDPSDLLLLTAESEALEAAGDFAGALAVRTVVVDQSANPQAKCESYHYRWRLGFWLGDYEQAAVDLAHHLTCMPTNWSYQYVYPALVHAGAGRDAEAGAVVARLIEDHGDDPMGVIWGATTLRLIGHGAEADDLLRDRRGELRLDSNDAGAGDSWLPALYDCCAGERAVSSVPDAGQDEEQRIALRAVVDFHAGVRFLAEGDRDRAVDYLTRAYRSFDGELGYTYHARLLLQLDAQDRLPYGG